MRAIVDAPPGSNTFWKAPTDAASSRRLCSGTMHSSPTGIEAHLPVLAARSAGSRTALGLTRSEFHAESPKPCDPPHAAWDQLVKATESVLRGDSDRVDVIKEGVKSKLQEVLPGGRDE
jgi:hypothetical protein